MSLLSGLTDLFSILLILSCSVRACVCVGVGVGARVCAFVRLRFSSTSAQEGGQESRGGRGVVDVVILVS